MLPSRENVEKELLSFWERLSQVQQLLITATSKEKANPVVQSGRASVIVTAPSPTLLIFHEKGYWSHEPMPGLCFSNSFRWTLDTHAYFITLEHLRYGDNHPVFLLRLTPKKSGALRSIDPHLCAEDTYIGNIVWNSEAIDFEWSITGPRKDQQLLYRYT